MSRLLIYGVMVASHDIGAMVAHYLKELDGPRAGKAWQSLVEIGPCVLPFLHGAYLTSRSAEVRLELIRALAELRDRTAGGLLQGALEENDERTWKTALDALVIIGGTEAIAVLRRARDIAGHHKQPWIAEALEQLEAQG